MPGLEKTPLLESSLSYIWETRINGKANLETRLSLLRPKLLLLTKKNARQCRPNTGERGILCPQSEQTRHFLPFLSYFLSCPDSWFMLSPSLVSRVFFHFQPCDDCGASIQQEREGTSVESGMSGAASYGSGKMHLFASEISFSLVNVFSNRAGEKNGCIHDNS